MRKPYVGPTKLILAFDIGTTFSGISYCILTEGSVPEILAVTKQREGHGDARVPSLLYYDKKSAVRAAGAEVLSEDVIVDALTEGWTKAEWWKLHLRPKHMASSISQENDLTPLPTGKSAVDVLSDFIKYLFLCVKTHINDCHPTVVWSSIENSTEFVFTHPNGWEGLQQQEYRHAIEQAGLIPSTPEGGSRVYMLREGEASLHYCIEHFLDTQPDDYQADPQGVVIIDAGGGAINLSMFSLFLNPIRCDEMAPAECHLQGSVFVTHRAGALIKEKLEGWENPGNGNITEYTREFDETTKLVIRNDKEPVYLRLASCRVDSQRYSISDGKLKLTGKEATSLFNDSIDIIINAFEQQQKSAPRLITMVFLVGGLSTNDWIWSQLQSYFTAKNIKICRADNHINKVVANGAVLSRVDCKNRLIATRVSRSTLGTVSEATASEDNVEHARRKSNWYRGALGRTTVPGYFTMGVRKGDFIREDMEFQQSLYWTETYPTNFGIVELPLTCYRGNLSNPPQWLDEDPSSFSTLCNIEIDLSLAAEDAVMKTNLGQTFYHLEFTTTIFFGLTEFQAKLSWQGKNGPREAPLTIRFQE